MTMGDTYLVTCRCNQCGSIEIIHVPKGKMKEEALTAECPNCGNGLEKKPTRKKKCPNCGKYMRVRSGVVVTEHRAEELDLLKRMSIFGVTQADFDVKKVAAKKAIGFYLLRDIA